MHPDDRQGHQSRRHQPYRREYIHLKTIPEADPDLLKQAGQYADRLSINIELPDDESITRLAPEKDGKLIRRTMANLGKQVCEAKAERKSSRKAPLFAPGGHSTQMIIGADASDDAKILTTSNGLYGSFGLKRVYYSAFSPIPDASSNLPVQAPPLLREHRLYQADWLLRFYGFSVAEIMQGGTAGQLDLTVDPKLAWPWFTARGPWHYRPDQRTQPYRLGKRPG